MIELEQKFLKINPGYMPQFEDMIKRFSQFGGGVENEKYALGRAFSNVYEFYIYAFFIGLYKRQKIDLTSEDKLKTFWEMINWKPREIVDHMLAIAIAESDFNMVAIEHLDDSEVVKEIKLVKGSIEAYANGGFMYISKLIEEDPEIVEHEDFFIKQLA